ncbi:MAG: hypothetical protein M3169_03255 [Candidatus Eremiobacteraeota bacterium]|nr:hypothetical protein [Candidatus Eremiobacteraeota bacterium]
MKTRSIAAALAAVAVCVCARPACAETPVVSLPLLDAAPSLNGVVDASWSKAATVTLDWDVQYNRSASPAGTRVHIARFRDIVYIAFENPSPRRATGTTRTDGSGVFNDDNDQVLFWPDGPTGFSYTFAANVLGTRYQGSSENTAYTPTWSAVGKQNAQGYAVEMAIPLGAMRSTGAGAWRIQFLRVDVESGSAFEWAHDRQQQSAGDVLYAGLLQGIRTQPTVAGARPRLQLYALGQAAPERKGGDTSRMGADLSVPLTRTSSFVASFHPDFSNVEIDQQSIAPSEFQRTFREVRPFFTQGSRFYNTTRCTPSCPYQILYTPAIPAFRDGYAIEGTQGLFGFGAFDALGTNRTDRAQSVTFRTRDQSVHAEAERVLVETADGFRDDVTMFGAGYANPHSHLQVFANAGRDQGSWVTDPSQAKYMDVGAAIGNTTSSYSVALRKLGAQFQPADGYVTNPDIAGWAMQGFKQINFRKGAFLRDVSLLGYTDRYHDHTGRVNEDDAGYQLNLDFRNQTTLHVFQNNNWLLAGNGQYLPFNQNGIFLGYRQATSTPTGILLSDGPFYHGRSSYVAYTTAFALRHGVTVSVEADRDAYAPSHAYAVQESPTTLWLQRLALDWQPTRRTSLDVGLRRIRGYAPPNGFAPPSRALLDATNVSIALHTFSPKQEWYIVYGDPNVFRTSPVITLKTIRYIGAPKGT